MKKGLLFLLILVITQTQSQNYQISFTGTGASSIVDSVRVENQNKGTRLLLDGSDILSLTVSSGVGELGVGSRESGVDIYPNPMIDNCLIGFEAIESGNATIELYDIAGKRIIHFQELLIKGHHKYSLSGIGSGIYFLKIELGELKTYSAKIVSGSEYRVSGNAEIRHVEATLNVSHLENVKHLLKSNKSTKQMAYTTGDVLKLTSISGIYRTVSTITPTQDQTITFIFVACTDIDGNNYSVVQIGTQVWMGENLKVTKYRNGDAISNITDNTQWASANTGAYCVYDNNPANSAIYGNLYNWRAVSDNKKIAPVGWHVATEAEITNLRTYLGGTIFVGGKLKETGTSHWTSPNSDATNETGFTALPSGNRYQGVFVNLGVSGWWWTSSTGGTSWAYYYSMASNNAKLDLFTYDKKDGFAVRCVKD